MARIDSVELDNMAQCRRGLVNTETGWRSGSFCRKPDLCRTEAECHFVNAAARHLERVWRPGRIYWIPGFDDEQTSLPGWAA